MPPTSLIDSLQSVRRKVRLLTLASGMGRLLAVAIALLVAIVFIDWSLGLDKLPRLALLILAGIGLVVLLWHWLARPAFSRIGLSDVAGHVEHAFPQFDDRLRSTINFSQSKVPGSESMQRRVVSEAQTLAERFDFHQVIVRRPLYYTAAITLAAVLGLGVLAWWGHESGWLSIAANRLALGNDQWPKTVEIALDSPTPQCVAVGDDVDVKLHLARGDKASRRAYLYYRYDNGPWTETDMNRAEDGAYTARLRAALEPGHKQSNLQVRVEAGDDQAMLSPVAIVPRMDVTRVEVSVAPPPYIQPQSVSRANLSDGKATMLLGSSVRMQVSFNKAIKPGSTLTLRPVPANRALPPMSWDTTGDQVRVASFRSDHSFSFKLEATDADGLAYKGSQQYEVSVVPDRQPTVQITDPPTDEDRTAVAGFDIKATADDDNGIVESRLVVNRYSASDAVLATAWNAPAPSAAPPWVFPILIGGRVAPALATWQAVDGMPDRKNYAMGYHLELPTLAAANLKPGDKLEFYIQVKDNFNLDGVQHDWVSSEKRVVTIISPEQWEETAKDKASQIQQQINARRLDQRREKAETEGLKNGLDANKKFDEADKAQAERLSGDQVNTQSQTMQLADDLDKLAKKMAENKSPREGLQTTAQDVAHDLRKAADSPMRDARQNLDAAKDQPPQSPNAKPDQQARDAADRAQAMDAAAKAQERAANQLQQAQDKLGQMGGLPEAIANLEAIKKDQEKIEKQVQDENKDNKGKTPDQLSKDDQDRNKKSSDQQNELGRKLEQALKNMSDKADQMKSDPTTSQAMKEAAKMGQQKGLPDKQKSAADDIQQNQQASAQQKQQDVELGLDQILNKLKEAQRRKLEEMSQQLAKMQQLVSELIRRQAGHNVDNLLIQGGAARVATLADKERDDLLTAAAIDPKDLAAIPAPRVGQLASSQEQTRGNTRDIAAQAESLPDPGPATKLTQAASHMERAVAHLKAEKVAPAYQPSQVDALAALVDAQKDLDAAMKKIQDKLQQQSAETIKQMYIKLLEEQKKIGQEVTTIDATPKDDNGDLPRPVAVRLGQLPTAQGKNIEEAQKIGEKLKDLDSVVYDWANKDIVRLMGNLKDNLAKPDTGKPTQLTEKRTERELQDMIDSLVQKINKSEFAQKGGGGGGGGKKPKLPSEAELRLVKKNQQFINEGTIEQDAQADKKDKDQVADLATRQHEMRKLLDKVFQKAGADPFGPEPDPNDLLPEEATKDDLDNKEIEEDLLHDKVTEKTVDKGVKATADRMARAGQYLDRTNAGKITQEIQRRIVVDMDDLIKMAQQTQAQSQSQPKPGEGQKMAQPGEGQPQNAGAQPGQPGQPGANPATDSTSGQNLAANGEKNTNVQEARGPGWGGITPRERQAVQESAGEKVIGKYKNLVEDYYRSLAEEAAKHR